MAAHFTEDKLSKPFVTEKDVVELVMRLYSIQVVEVKEFESYMDRAFLVKTAPGEGIDSQTNFILKILNTSDTTDHLEAVATQMAVVDHLRQFPELKCQVAVPTVEGKLLSYEMLRNDWSIDGVVRSQEGLSAVRMFFYLPGQPLDDVHSVPTEFFYKMGQHIGALQQALQTYPGDVQPLKERANIFFWSSENIQGLKQHLQVVEDALQRALVEDVIDEALRTVAPIQGSLRQGIVAYDCSHWNTLVQASASAKGDFEITGIIDFDGMMHTALVYEVAVLMMYMMLCCESPLEGTARLLAGFESRAPLPENERRLLRVLIAGRFAFSLVFGLVLHKAHPDIAYILSSQAKGWECLKLIWKQSADDLMKLWDRVKNSCQDQKM